MFVNSRKCALNSNYMYKVELANSIRFHFATLNHAIINYRGYLIPVPVERWLREATVAYCLLTRTRASCCLPHKRNDLALVLSEVVCSVSRDVCDSTGD